MEGAGIGQDADRVFVGFESRRCKPNAGRPSVDGLVEALELVSEPGRVFLLTARRKKKLGLVFVESQVVVVDREDLAACDKRFGGEGRDGSAADRNAQAARRVAQEVLERSVYLGVVDDVLVIDDQHP